MKRVAIASAFAIVAGCYAQLPMVLLAELEPASPLATPAIAATVAFLAALAVRKATPFAGAVVAFSAFVAALVYVAATDPSPPLPGRNLWLRFAALFALGAATFGWPGCLLGAMIGSVCQRLTAADPRRG